MIGDKEIIERMFSLVDKYKHLGLSLYIEFARGKVVIRGYWDRRPYRDEIVNFNREYFLTRYEKYPADTSVLESAVDVFKKDFERKLEEDDRK